MDKRLIRRKKQKGKIFVTNKKIDSNDSNLTKLCRARIQILEIQREDLRKCLFSLVEDCCIGNRYIKIYRQFKMYNDSRFNENIT